MCLHSIKTKKTSFLIIYINFLVELSVKNKKKTCFFDMIPLKWTHEINKRVSMEVGFFYGKKAKIIC